LHELAEQSSMELQSRLANAERDLAEGVQILGHARELLATVDINRLNFLDGCPLLISATGAQSMRNAINREDSARSFLDTWVLDHPEDIFRAELGLMQDLFRQLRADVHYFELTFERL